MRDNAVLLEAGSRKDAMKLPNQQLAAVPREKVVDYLLSTTHRDGRHKAAFFNAFGFTIKNWQDLQMALVRHAADHEVAEVEASPFGTRYVVEGIMAMADGRNALVRTIWFIETGTDMPRFVTAYPL
jgi:hypothetical protein